MLGTPLTREMNMVHKHPSLSLCDSNDLVRTLQWLHGGGTVVSYHLGHDV